MKMIGPILLTLFFISISIILSLGLYRSWKTQVSPNQKIFLQGKLPVNLPDGFYRGSVTGFKSTWQGKKFDAKSKKGINIFKKENNLVENYPFKFYASKGLADNIEVIRIDYNIPQNPFWLRFIKDEIVEVGKDKFLGKLNINLFPGITFSLGYFRLEK